MKFIYAPKSEYEKFGSKIYNLLVENSGRPFYVGGMVRDLILGKKVTDIDIATTIKPDDVVSLIDGEGITVDVKAKRFGTVTALKNSMRVEITTLRRESYKGDRYPQVKFVSSPKIDSLRRDFTVNSLYLSQKDQKILDFHHGLLDLESKQLNFIGNPGTRIKEDPLRILRALRFCLVLDLKMGKKTFKSIKKNFHLLKFLTNSRMQTEISKIKKKKEKNILTNILNNPALLDKYFI